MALALARLRVADLDGRSVVTESLSRTPLRLLHPRNHGHAAWAYQSSHGGGMVGADHVDLDVVVEPRCTLFLSSQSASKVYRDARAAMTLTAELGERAALVLWPDPLVCFAGARYTQALTFRLDPSASLVCVDTVGAGRVASGERWAFAELSLRLALEIGGERLLTDALLLSERHGALPARLAEHHALATVVLAGPAAASAIEAFAQALAAPPVVAAPVQASLSAWPWGAVVRVAARDAQHLTDWLRAQLRAPVATLLGDDPWARKW